MSHRNLLLNAGEEMNRCTEGSNEGDWAAFPWHYQTTGIMWLQREEIRGTCDKRISKTDNYCAGAIAVATVCSA